MANHLELATIIYFLLWYNTMIVLPTLLLIAASRRNSFTSQGFVRKIGSRIERHAATTVQTGSILLGIAIAAYGETMPFEASYSLQYLYGSHFPAR
jgi:hypothetical protein